MTNQNATLERETAEKTARHLRKLQSLASGRQLIVIQYRFQQWLDETVDSLKLRKRFSASFENTADRQDRLPVIAIKSRRIMRYGRTTAGGIEGKRAKRV